MTIRSYLRSRERTVVYFGANTGLFLPCCERFKAYMSHAASQLESGLHWPVFAKGTHLRRELDRKIALFILVFQD